MCVLNILAQFLSSCPFRRHLGSRYQCLCFPLHPVRFAHERDDSLEFHRKIHAFVGGLFQFIGTSAKFVIPIQKVVELRFGLAVLVVIENGQNVLKVLIGSLQSVARAVLQDEVAHVDDRFRRSKRITEYENSVCEWSTYG